MILYICVVPRIEFTLKAYTSPARKVLAVRRQQALHVANRYGSGDVKLSLAEQKRACRTKREFAQCMEIIAYTFVSEGDCGGTVVKVLCYKS